MTYSPEPGVQKTVVFFAAAADSTSAVRPQPEEVSALKWMWIEDAIREVTYDTDKEVLRHAAAYIRER